MKNEANMEETMDDFFDALGEHLKEREGADTELADILKTHVLKASPAPDAVEQAKEAIVNLAYERAKTKIENG